MYYNITCFNAVAFLVCRHPDPTMRPLPSTILKYLLQLDCLAEMNDVPRSGMFEIGADVSAGAGLHSDLQDTYLLYVNSKANKNDTGPYVNVDRRGSNISKEVYNIIPCVTSVTLKKILSHVHA